MPKLSFSAVFERYKGAAAEIRHAQSLAGAGLLSAVSLVLNQFTIMVSPLLEIGFSFLGIAACAFLYGPWVAGISGIIIDLLGYFLRPNGAFFPGYILNEFLAGFIYGAWLYKRPVSIWRTFLACLSVVIVINLFLSPLWLNIMYGNAYAISTLRLIKNAIKLPVDTALLYGVLKLAERHHPHSLQK